ncbi:relaxase/mobilization nuclease domain-containing protein [Nioella sp. MMSF_3534]|uniref:relaxase/mobilization nuclease domain-containing protein n=1 Tax=Nioella sp. MMSF_3534 TaxID=3046720 RepID=UPI00273FF633|nr:relaxase/mobilization nuclease domain-containing protein [Nioella sp. MMSF_3534]
MIIKSMSRKAPTFGQLADYIARGSNVQTGTAFVRNLYASGRDRDAVVGQFLDNYRHLPVRKGGNALYHEVVVLEPQPHLSTSEIEAALHDLAERYCEKRAPHQLAWGHVHHDTDFPHIHLMISANAVRSERRVRMEKSYFANVQRDLERWRSEHLPEISARVVYDKPADKETPKQPIQEGELVRRTGEPSRKQQVFTRLKPVFENAPDRAALFEKLQETGFELYQRGQNWGVIEHCSGRRYRLRTLGLIASFDRLPDKERPTPPKTNDDPRAHEMLRRRMARRADDVIDRFDRDEH